MSKNPLSALSYTNKDFQTIYIELLDLVKQLTKKWDPSISNESDPGVILLKLNAIIADKNNYNIDKNILEAFPQTVTQEVNARNLYEQLAYRMPWYQSGETTVQFRWKGESLTDGQMVTIPEYTMLTDVDGSIVYTTLNKVELYHEHPISTVQAAQGIITTYTVNNSAVVTMSNLDNNRRLYLGDYTVAQNQIFITNITNSVLWKQVDNLAVEQLGNKFYEFGIDARTSSCFVEFPEDIDQLIGEGLTVKYLVSQGESGNIAAKFLDRLYEEISVNVGKKSVALTADVLEVYNTVPSKGGKDPQSITDAFSSYKKVVGTFHTLVTLRDYINFIQSTEMVSNGFVCDRTNDVQSCYTVVTDSVAAPTHSYVSHKSGSSSKISYTKPVNDPFSTAIDYYSYDSNSGGMVLVDSSNVTIDNYQTYYIQYTEPELSAFDLRMYVLEKPSDVDSIDSYESTFNVVPSESVVCNNILGYMLDEKCVQHDFQPIIPDRPCMFRNSFPIRIKIVPTKVLTTNEISSVRMNILASLRKVLDASKVSFGITPSYDIVYDAVQSSDERIKTCIIDDFEYTTFAIYWNGEQFIEIPVSSTKRDSIINCSCTVENSSPSDLKKYYIDEQEKKDFFSSCYFICDQLLTKEGEFQSSTPATMEEGSTTVKYYIYRWNRSKDLFELYSDKLTDIRLDIIAKSILAGKTSLYKQDTSFAMNLNQQYVDAFSTDRITTGLVVAPNNSDLTDTEDTLVINLGKDSEDNKSVKVPGAKGYVGAYTLKKNESVRFLGPLLETSNSYTGYVKFEACLHDKGYQLVAMPYDESKEYLGKAYLSETDYDKICLKDWKDLYYASIVYYNADANNKIVTSEEALDLLELGSVPSIKRSLVLDNNRANPSYSDRLNAQATLIVPTSSSQRYDTKYTISFGAHKVENIEGNDCISSNSADLDIVITPFLSSDGTGSYTDYEDVVSKTSILNDLYDNTTGRYTMEYVKPQEAGSFTLSFRCRGDMYVALTNIEIVEWRTDVSAPLREIYKYYSKCSAAPILPEGCPYEGNLYTPSSEDPDNTPVQYIKISKAGGEEEWYASVSEPKELDKGNYYISFIVPDDNESLKPNESTKTLMVQQIDSSEKILTEYPYKYYKYELSNYLPITGYNLFEDWEYSYRASYFTAEYGDDGLVFVPVSHVYTYSLSLDACNIVNCGEFDKYFTSHNARWTWELDKHDDNLYWSCDIDTNDGDPYPHIEMSMWKTGDIQFRFIQDICQISPETSYKLRKGEYVTFFWREQDADDAPYKYKRLVGISPSEETVDVKSPIIQPTFLLYASPVKNKGTVANPQYDYSETIVDPTLLSDEGNILYGTDNYIRVSGMYGDNDLSGTKELKIQTLKQVTSTPRRDGNYISRYFFITNDKKTLNLDGLGDKEYCYLKFHRIPSDTAHAKYRYYLGPDETFVYMNDKGTAYTILGSGTMLGIDFDIVNNLADAKECWANSKKWQTGEYETVNTAPQSYWKAVPACDYTELTTRGLEILDTESLNIKSSELFIASEQQLFTVVEGDTLRVTVKQDRSAIGDVENSLYGYIDDYGTNRKTYAPVFTSFANTYVTSDFNVSYTTGTTTIDLPRIDLDDNGDARWMGRAALNLSSSSVDPQSISSITPHNEHILNEGISLQYIVNEDNIYPEVFAEDGEIELSPLEAETIQIETDVIQDKVGGNNIDVSYLSWAGDKKETYFYIYIDNPEYRLDCMSVDSKHNVNIRLDQLFEGSTSNPEDLVLRINLQPASYILQIRNTSKHCSIEFKGASLQHLSSRGTFSSIDHYGTYYAMLTVPAGSTASQLTIKVTKSSGAQLTDTDSLVIAPFYRSIGRERWKTFKYLYGISDEDILSRIDVLDYNDLFKYNYVVPEETEIEDPLEASSFFNDNHVFREFTIPKAECRISDATNSKIQIVNNR